MGAIVIDWLEEVSLRALQHQLRKEDYHVFHYIGHGGFDQAADDGVLLFEDEHGRGRRVSGIELGTILADEVSLRLAVLNSCEGARSSLQDPFSGVATSLIEREIPAVIGMQFEITDRAAIVFAAEFYSVLADGLPVDFSVAEARKAIYADQNDIEWGTPVLFMRVADGRLFDVQPHPPVRPPEPGPGAEPEDVRGTENDAASQEAALHPGPVSARGRPLRPGPSDRGRSPGKVRRPSANERPGPNAPNRSVCAARPRKLSEWLHHRPKRWCGRIWSCRRSQAPRVGAAMRVRLSSARVMTGSRRPRLLRSRARQFATGPGSPPVQRWTCRQVCHGRRAGRRWAA